MQQQPPFVQCSSACLLQDEDDPLNVDTLSTGLPTGMLVSPFAPLHPPAPQLQRTPVLCVGCGAYPNPFNSVFSRTGEWRCAFCSHANTCYSEELIDRGLHGAFGSGSGRLADETPRSNYPELCSPVVDYVDRSLGTMLGGGHSASGQPPNHHAPFPPRFEVNRSTSGGDLSLTGGSPPKYLFLVDGNMAAVDLEALAEAVEGTLKQLEPHALVGLVVFTGVVSVYHLGRLGVAVADVLPGLRVAPPSETLQVLQGRMDTFVRVAEGGSRLCQVLKNVRGVGEKGAPTTPQGGSGRPHRRRSLLRPHRRKRCLGAAVSYALRLLSTESGGVASGTSSRLVMFIGGGGNYGAGACIPLIPCPVAPASQETSAAELFFRGLAQEAMQQGIGVDVFSTGSDVPSVICLQALVQSTGGNVVVSNGQFGSELQANLVKALMLQHMTFIHKGKGRGTIGGGSGTVVCGALLDVRTTSNVRLSHVVGHACLTEEHDDVDQVAYNASIAAAKLARGEARKDGGDGSGASRKDLESVPLSKHSQHLSRMRLGRVDPQSSLAFFLSGANGEGKGDEQQQQQQEEEEEEGEEEGQRRFPEALVQVVVRWTKRSGQCTTRVTTQRLPLVEDVAEFYASVDADVSAVLVGKQAVLNTDAAQARQGVDQVWRSICQFYREELMYNESLREGGSSFPGAAPDEDLCLPSVVRSLPFRLFVLRHGPLLGQRGAGVDGQLVLRNHFLRAGLETGLQMLCDRMVSFRLQKKSQASDPNVSQSPAEVVEEEVPLATMCLLPDRVLLLDGGDRIFVWKGRDVVRDARRQHSDALALIHHAMAKAESRTEGRYPHSPILQLDDGSSDARYLTSRLSPSHKDSPEEQVRAYPSLATLPPQMIQALRAQLPLTDDMSFREWLWHVIK